MISGKYQDFLNAEEFGARAHFPRRDSHARAEREKPFRPSVGVIVSNPQTVNQIFANLPRRHEGFILLKFREIVKNL